MKRITRHAIAAAALLLAACSSDPGVAPKLEVDVFGWAPSAGFVPGLPQLQDAQTVRVKATRPSIGEVVSQDTSTVAARSLNLPEIPFGSDLRLDFEVLDSTGEIIGGGSTPTFDFSEERQLLSFRVQVTEINSFAPVGNVVVDRETQERKFAWTQLDYRQKEGVSWLGRTGHATAMTDDGRVLVVGGGDPTPGSDPAEIPQFRSVYDDVQIFDPKTGYFSDLAFDEATGTLLADGDRLFEPVVFHTVTAIGDNQFLVAGGFTPRMDVMRPVNTLQIIDLNAAKGSRVRRLVATDGSSLVLKKARGWHTATYRDVDQQVVIAGGVGPQGEDDILATFELIDIASSTVSDDPLDMQEARAQHSAVLMNDGRSIWMVGGHDDGGALASTEIVARSDAGTTESEAGPSMRTPRFGLAALNVSAGSGDILLVAGGFTDRDGAVDDSFEVSRLGRDMFTTGTPWKLSEGRGGVRAIELPQTGDVVLLGGRAADGFTVESADILTLEGLDADPPFSATSSDAAATPRFGASVDLLTSGRILLVGGVGEVNSAQAGLDTADFFNPMDPVGQSGGGMEVVIVQ